MFQCTNRRWGRAEPEAFLDGPLGRVILVAAGHVPLGRRHWRHFVTGTTRFPMLVATSSLAADGWRARHGARGLRRSGLGAAGDLRGVVPLATVIPS